MVQYITFQYKTIIKVSRNSGEKLYIFTLYEVCTEACSLDPCEKQSANAFFAGIQTAGVYADSI